MMVSVRPKKVELAPKLLHRVGADQRERSQWTRAIPGVGEKLYGAAAPC